MTLKERVAKAKDTQAIINELADWLEGEGERVLMSMTEGLSAKSALINAAKQLREM